MKTGLQVLLAAAVALTATASAHAGKVKVIKIAQGVYKAGQPVPQGPVIKVLSNDGQSYHSVAASNPLHFNVKVWAMCNVFSADAYARVKINATTKTLASGLGSNQWDSLHNGKRVGVSTAWAPPAMPGGPVAACNGELTRRANQGTPRWRLLQQGFGLKIANAYTGELEVRCGAVIPDTETRTTHLDGWIHCLPSPLAQAPPQRPNALAARAALPDVTSLTGLRIGGQLAPWGGTISLSAADALETSHGHCKFRYVYDAVNTAGVPAAPAFLSRLSNADGVLADNAGIALAANQTRNLSGHLRLKPGSHVVKVFLDRGAVVSESNEANNQKRVRVELEGPCGR